MTSNERSWIRQERARRFRRRMTREEALLWKLIKSEALGVKFRRQYGIGPYIVDFACLHPKLVVEVDGSHHLESQYDLGRDRFLRGRGFEVLRFWNEDVWTQSGWVVRQIQEELHRLDPRVAPPLD
ncbi:MAG TPA: DUF559 domain-containing protein [Acidimicrobiia bacterium]